LTVVGDVVFVVVDGAVDVVVVDVVVVGVVGAVVVGSVVGTVGRLRQACATRSLSTWFSFE